MRWVCWLGRSGWVYERMPGATGGGRWRDGGEKIYRERCAWLVLGICVMIGGVMDGAGAEGEVQEEGSWGWR